MPLKQWHLYEVFKISRRKSAFFLVTELLFLIRNKVINYHLVQFPWVWIKYSSFGNSRKLLDKTLFSKVIHVPLRSQKKCVNSDVILGTLFYFIQCFFKIGRNGWIINM
jgi:hypothetical protein